MGVHATVPELGDVLFDSARIRSRVRQLGQEITRDFEGDDLVVVSVLRGGAVFVSDLVRQIDLPMVMDFLAVRGYGSTTAASGIVGVLKDLDLSITGRRVLLVEDIVDTGLTLGYLVEMLMSRLPASLEVCVLLDKPARRIVDVPVKYKGFDLADLFVVGYGLDFDQDYRELPYVASLRVDWPAALPGREADGLGPV